MITLNIPPITVSSTFTQQFNVVSRDVTIALMGGGGCIFIYHILVPLSG